MPLTTFDIGRGILILSTDYGYRYFRTEVENARYAELRCRIKRLGFLCCQPPTIRTFLFGGLITGYVCVCTLRWYSTYPFTEITDESCVLIKMLWGFNLAALWLQFYVLYIIYFSFISNACVYLVHC